MADLVVAPCESPLRGSVPVPGDKSIAHRAIVFAGLARGKSKIAGGSLGADNESTLAALAAMGVRSERDEDALVVEGRGLDGLEAPGAAIDCGNSGTTMRLLCGVLAAQRFQATLVGDASLMKRPMERVARPLRLRGARIEGKMDPKRAGEITAPIVVGPLPAPHRLAPLEYAMPIASAQVKSAILLSGLWADGATYVQEPVVSRDHTERMLAALGVPVRTMATMIELDVDAWRARSFDAFSVRVPGDLSAAAFVIAAAQIVSGSRVDVRRVGTNPTRTGFLDLVRAMNGAATTTPLGDEMGEPIADVAASSANLVATNAGGELVTRAIDEIPVFCALAARARGTSIVEGAAELRVKESDRLAAMARVLRAFGVECEERPDGIAIEGRPEGALVAADVSSEGDHRVAMTAAILALVANQKCRVRDADCILTSFPRFVGTMRALGANIEVKT